MPRAELDNQSLSVAFRPPVEYFGFGKCWRGDWQNERAADKTAVIVQSCQHQKEAQRKDPNNL